MKIDDLCSGVINEDLKYEFKAKINFENNIQWAKTLVAFANGEGGNIFIGVSNDREAFGLTLEEIDETKNLIAVINDRSIFPHIKYKISMISVDDANKFVLIVKIYKSESIVRYRDGDFNEKVFIEGDGNSTSATPEEIISLPGRKYGVDNHYTDIDYDERLWSKYLRLCENYRSDFSKPSIKELQNEEIVSIDKKASYGLLMFKDDFNDDMSLICCRLWSGNEKSSNVIDSIKLKGPLCESFPNVLSFIERNTKPGWKKRNDGGRESITSYPFLAVREAVVNAFVHRDYSIMGTQIDVDIFTDRIDITSPGSWLLPRSFESHSIGYIPSIRRNKIISACFDIANLMERNGSGFKTIFDCYTEVDDKKQPVVLTYLGFFIIRLFDLLYDEKKIISNKALHSIDDEKQRVINLLMNNDLGIKELQNGSIYKSRTRFNQCVIKSLLNEELIERVGNIKSKNAYFRIKK